MKKSNILVLIGIIIIAIIGIIIFLFVGSDSNYIVAEEGVKCQLINEESSEYMLTNIPTDYVFEIKEVKGDSFTVTDILGNDVNIQQTRVENEIKISPPENGYEDGQLYYLDLEMKGRFKNPDFEKAQKIIFCTSSEEKKIVKYTEKVRKINGEKLQIDGDQIIVDGVFGSGDILVSDVNEDGVEEIYVLEDAIVDEGITRAVKGATAPQNVYEDLDVFYYGHVNLENTEINEEEFKGRLIETGFMDALTDSVYAGDDFEVEAEVKKGKGKYEFIADITVIDPSEKGRKVMLSFGFKDDVLVKVDEDIAVFDNTITITDAIEFTVEGQDKEATEERISNALEAYVAEDAATDKGEHEIPLVPITIPIAGPIAVYVDVGLTLETEYTTEFNAGVNTELIMKQGIIYNLSKKELNKVYGDISGDIDAHILVKGKLDAFAGAFIEAGLEVPIVITAGLEALGGPYLEAEGCFSIEGIPKDIKTKGYYKTELGTMFEANVTYKALWFDEKEIELVEKRKPFYEKSKYLKVKDLNIKEEYLNLGNSINLGPLYAVYGNVITGEVTEHRLESFKVHVDEKSVEIFGGKIISPIDAGKHTLSIEWEYEGQKFSYTCNVEVINVDYGMLIGMSRAQIESSFGKLELLEQLDIYDDPRRPVSWYYSPELNLRIRFDSIDYYPNSEGIPCTGVSGTVQQLFRIDKKMSIEEFCAKTNKSVPLSIGDDLMGRSERFANKDYFGMEDIPYGYMKLEASNLYNGVLIRISKLSDEFNIYPESLCSINQY